MKKLGWRVKLGAALVAATAVLMVVHYLIFRDAYNLAFYSVHTIVMMPLEVLFVTIILNALLERRSRQEMLHKLNMVIGAFFSEVGSDLLRSVSVLDQTREVREQCRVDGTWDAARYAAARRFASAHRYRVSVSTADLEAMRDFLIDRHQSVLALLQHQNLLEHGSFTDALWAVSHVAEELRARTSFEGLPESDLQHLEGDIERAYAALTVEGLGYARHLQSAYPYLFSLAVRTSPLDPEASAIVR